MRATSQSVLSAPEYHVTAGFDRGLAGATMSVEPGLIRLEKSRFWPGLRMPFPFEFRGEKVVVIHSRSALPWMNFFLLLVRDADFALVSVRPFSRLRSLKPLVTAGFELERVRASGWLLSSPIVSSTYLESKGLLRPTAERTILPDGVVWERREGDSEP